MHYSTYQESSHRWETEKDGLALQDGKDVDQHRGRRDEKKKIEDYYGRWQAVRGPVERNQSLLACWSRSEVSNGNRVLQQFLLRKNPIDDIFFCNFQLQAT